VQATISSGLYRFLAIAVLLDVKDIPQVGPPMGADHDDGVGLPADFDLGKSRGLGMRIVAGLSEQLQAAISHRAGVDGTEFVLTLPPSSKGLRVDQRRDDARERGVHHTRGLKIAGDS
jgi:hypothetical protein